MKKTEILLFILPLALMLTTCKKTPEIPDSTNKIIQPSVVTKEIYDITKVSANCSGEVIDSGNGTISKRGVCWNTSGNPTLENNTGITEDGDGTGTFTSQITGLSDGTTYYVAAYATNEKVTGYGEVKEFVSLFSLTDPRDGNVYLIVNIGTQIWMAENLNYQTGNSWCFNNAPSNCETYGRLYDWETIMNGENSSNNNPSGVQGICPDGWHIPSDNEWQQLEMYLGMSQNEADDTGYRGTNEGEKLKSTIGWNSGGNGTNEVGFSALPGGYRDGDGNFINLGSYGFWWSATEYSSASAWTRRLDYYYDKVYRSHGHGKERGFSVRCVRD